MSDDQEKLLSEEADEVFEGDEELAAEELAEEDSEWE